MPAGIAEPDIWGESFVEAWHTRDLAQFAHYWGVAGDVRRWNGYHVPSIGTLAILVTNGRGGLSVAELAKLADYQELVAGVLSAGSAISLAVRRVGGWVQDGSLE